MTDSEILSRLTSIPGITSPNPMQADALRSTAPQLIIIAPTGSGKTLAFGVRMLKVLSEGSKTLQGIVIAPSRELVVQIAGVLRQLAKGLKTVELYGGHSFADETASLSPLPAIIIATPGRLLDHLQRGSLEISHSLDVLVIDEYDKALQLGFEGEMKRIVRRIGIPGNLILTSATELKDYPSYLGLKNPETIICIPEKEKAARLEIVSVESFSRDKLDTLSALLRTLPVQERAIVFVNHRESAERVYRRLKSDGISAGLYHGALDQQQRMMALDLFTNGTTPVLVATDLAARGLDIEAVGSVIHYHLPVDREAWIHRNGRTARQDASGRVFVITSEADTMPDFIGFDHAFQPPVDLPEPGCAKIGTLYFSAGKKEKISRGDIAGFILSNTGLSSARLGKIIVHDHCALAAVLADDLKKLVSTLSPLRLKGKKVKITPIFP